MNPDLPPDLSDDQTPGDWLEDALRSRPAITPPVTFTASVMELATASPRSTPSPQTTDWIQDAGRAGLAFAALGAASTIDVSRLAGWLDRGLAAPTPLILAALVLFVGGVWYSAMAVSPEFLD